jgi:hypothetical protein
MNLKGQNQIFRRGRFIAPTADVSALGGLHDIPFNVLNFMIGPPSLSLDKEEGTAE